MIKTLDFSYPILVSHVEIILFIISTFGLTRLGFEFFNILKFPPCSHLVLRRFSMMFPNLFTKSPCVPNFCSH